MHLKSKNFRKINYNKWGKNIGDCLVRAVVGAFGLDYEVACKLLHVDCKKGVGFDGDDGIDLYQMERYLGKWMSPIKELLPSEDDPFKFEGELPLDKWVDEHKKDDKIYLVYVTDWKDGGHIVYVNCKKNCGYFVDTFDSGNIPVNAWCEVEQRVPKDSKYHWKYDKKTKRFI
jgi:hypothetical protein